MAGKLPLAAGLLLALLGVVFAAATLVWLNLDRVPPNWDDAWYLTNSLAVYDALAHGGIIGYFKKLGSVFGFKAPLIAALPTPFYLLLGRRWHAAYLVNIASMLALFWFVQDLARRWWNARAAVLAVAIVGTMPLLYGLARWFMVEYALTAMLAAAIWLLVRSEGLEKQKFVFLFGMVCGFGLLLKISFAAFILFPFLYAWTPSRYRGRALLIAMLPCLLLALPWYAFHLRPVIENALAAGFGESASIQGTGAIFSFGAIGRYLSIVTREGLSGYYVVWAAMLVGWIAAQVEGRVFLRNLCRKGPGLLLFWLIPFVIFLFGGNKDVRYIAPILPAFALLLASMLDSAIPRSIAGDVISCLILVVPLVQMFAVSFGVPFHAAELGYARHFNRTIWPHDEILRTMSANSTFRPGERQLLLVATDRGSFNADNVELAVAAAQLPFNVETTAHEKNLNVLLSRLDEASFVLFKEGGEAESPVINPHFDELVRRVRADNRYTEIPYRRRLPDGGVVRIFKNSARHSRLADRVFLKSGLDQAAEFRIDFGEMIELAGLSIARTADSLTVKYRWQCLKRANREYWCFTHILDPDGRIIGQLDHRLLDGEPPLESWQPGDGALEELRFQIPKDALGKTISVRLGLYDPPSGERLRIAMLQGPAESRFRLVDQATALLTAFGGGRAQESSQPNRSGADRNRKEP